jgi:HSP20 family protein
VEVYAFAPGLDAASIAVTVDRGVLKISGERRGAERAEEEVQAYATERPQGRFTRALSLPDDIDTSKVEAKYRNGVLQVSIGLQEAAQPKRITVQ